MLILDSSKVRRAVQGILPWNEVGFSENDNNDWSNWFLNANNDIRNTLTEEYYDLEGDGEDVDWSLFQSELEGEVFTRLCDALIQSGYTLNED